MNTVAIQGVEGSFHDQAVQELMPGAEVLACATFQDVFEAVTKDKVPYGVVAIENSLHGSINPVSRLLERNNVWVSGEVTLTIEQFLLGVEPMSLEALNTPEAEVRTMFPAFAQCELWLQEHLPQARRTEMYDTAYSLVTVLDEKNPLAVAIAGRRAMEVYGGHVIAGPINDDPHNFTRFILSSKDTREDAKANRTMLILTTSHSDGALYHALGAFAKEGI
ncbi:MAG: prephenate dehydratase domain-containing protein, partial [Candidatus Paceibacterota bacterium]